MSIPTHFTPNFSDMSKSQVDASRELLHKFIGSKIDVTSTWTWAQILRFNSVLSVIEAIPSQEVEVLDIGCSESTFYGFFSNCTNSNKSLIYTGLEPRLDLVSLGFNRYNGESGWHKNDKNQYSVLQYDANKTDIRSVLPENKKYDVILFQQVIEHIDKDCGLFLLDVIRTLLKPGGKLILSSPNPDKENGQEIILEDHHIYEYSFAEISEILETLGYEILEVNGWLANSFYEDKLNGEELELLNKLGKASPSFAKAFLCWTNMNLTNYYFIVLSVKE